MATPDAGYYVSVWTEPCVSASVSRQHGLTEICRVSAGDGAVYTVGAEFDFGGLHPDIPAEGDVLPSGFTLNDGIAACEALGGRVLGGHGLPVGTPPHRRSGEASRNRGLQERGPLS